MSKRSTSPWLLTAGVDTAAALMNFCRVVRQAPGPTTRHTILNILADYTVMQSILQEHECIDSKHWVAGVGIEPLTLEGFSFDMCSSTDSACMSYQLGYEHRHVLERHDGNMGYQFEE